MKRILAALLLIYAVTGCAPSPQPAPPVAPAPAVAQAPVPQVQPPSSPMPAQPGSASVPPNLSAEDIYLNQAIRSTDMVSRAVMYNDRTTLNDIVQSQATIRQARVELAAIPVPPIAAHVDMLFKQACAEAEAGAQMAEKGMRFKDADAYAKGATHFQKAEALLQRASAELRRMQKLADQQASPPRGGPTASY